jgi:dephospho-CoA kinase
MLRVGLTGGLGAGKSTVLRLFADRGAKVLQSDAIGRELMQPGEPVYDAIVATFGESVVLAGGDLDRAALARLAFEGGRVEELNRIVHPAVIARQEALMRAMPADAVVVVESALIFETKYGAAAGQHGWRERFDRLVLVTAPEPVKIARFLARSGATAETAAALTAEAHRRLAAQMPDETKMDLCDFILHNDGDLAGLEAQVDRVWQALVRDAVKYKPAG